MPAGSAAQVGRNQLEDLVAATVDDRFEQEEAETLGLLKRDLGRHGEFLFGRDRVDQHRPVVGEGAPLRRFDLGR